ncbi:glycosyltransferase family 2 protein [Candidatus Uhrbacteria bacterium]|nr:glycosyltransferase family 2 protein [Candidatus Uhrbacteria bacterium]
MDKNIGQPKPGTPLVSVLLPVLNGADSVRAAVRSVLTQDCGDLELIVIDDGSTDRTAAIVSELARTDRRMVLLRNESNLGIQKSLNRGLARACGKYVARLDVDDVWIGEDKLGRQVEFLEGNLEHVLVGTAALFVGGRQGREYPVTMPQADAAIRRRLLGKNCFLHGSILARREAIGKVGGYDESPECRHVEDYDLWLRLGRVGKVANLGFVGLRYALSPTGLSAKNLQEQCRKHLYLTRKYRTDYPGYFRAMVRNRLRLISAPFRCRW